VHHGYLNLVLGTARAAAKAPPESVAEVLASTDEDVLVAEFRALSARIALLTRAMFRAYGSCNTSEPLAEAAALGLLDEDASPSPSPSPSLSRPASPPSAPAPGP
jgi:hypothetical protein